MKSLTVKQEKFALEYVRTGNSSLAYRRSYNTENMKTESVHRKAHDVLHNVNVRARIDELKQDLAKTMGAEKATLIAILQEVINRAMTGQPIMTYDKVEKCMVHLTDEMGNVVYQADNSAVNKAIAELNKMLGHYEAVKTENTNTNINYEGTNVNVNTSDGVIKL